MFLINRLLKEVILLFFLSLSVTLQANDGSIKLHINCSDKHSKETNRNLGRVEKFFLIIEQEEIEFFFDKKDTCFLFGNFTGSQVKYLEKVHLVPMKLILNSKCYMTNFPAFELYFNANRKEYEDYINIPDSLSFCFLNNTPQFNFIQKQTYLVSFPVYEKEQLDVREYYSNGKRNFIEREYIFLQEVNKCR